MSARVLDFLRALCECFPDQQGNPRVMTETQIAMYGKRLANYDNATLTAALETHMARSKWFPSLAELVEILEPQVDTKALAELAWASVLTAIRRGGVYRGATFETGAVGEAMRQVFGSWSAACSFDTDSPGWTVRRQSFLAIFPTLLSRAIEPVTLPGLHGSDRPYQVPALQGAPVVAALPAHDPQLSRDEAVGLLAALAKRRDAERRKKVGGE